MPHSSWGSRCATANQLKTVAVNGWEFNTPSHPGTSTDGFQRQQIKLRVRSEIAPIVAYLAQSTADAWGGVRAGATWSTVCRKIRGGSKLSNHAFGLALDFSSDRGPMVKRKSTDLFDPRICDWPEDVVRLWESFGWRWGGKYGTTYQGRSGSGVLGFPDGLKGVVGRTVDCFTGDTRIITKNGPVALSDVAGTEVELLTVSADPTQQAGVEPEWRKVPVRSYGFDDTFEVTLERGKGRERTTIRATANHRWPVFPSNAYKGLHRFVTTEELAVGDALSTVDMPHEPVELDPESVARGIAWGDGSVYNRHGGGRTPRCDVRLYGSKEDLRSWFEPWITEDRSRGGEGAYTKRVDYDNGPDSTSGSGLSILRLPAWLKSAPHPWSNDEVLAGFFAGWFATDGGVPASGYPASLSTADPAMLSWIKAAAPRLGVTIGSINRQAAGKSGFGSNRDVFTVTFRSVPEHLLIRSDQRALLRPPKTMHRWKVVEVRKTGLVEEVFCPTVEGVNVVAIDTPSVPVMVGQCMHIEFMGSVAEANRLAPIATRFFLEGKWGLAPDGTPILANATPTLEEWEMPLEDDDIDQIIVASYVGFAGRRPSDKDLAQWRAEFKAKGYPVALAKLQRGLASEFRTRLARAAGGSA